MQLRRNSELKLSASRQATPSSRNNKATGRLDPSPKFAPPTTMSPARTISGQPLRDASNISCAACGIGSRMAYPGNMSSVVTSSPKVHERPESTSSCVAVGIRHLRVR